MLRQRRPGPLIITGEPGVGRTSLLVQALAQLDRGRDVPIVVGRLGPHELPAGGRVLTVPASPSAIARVGGDIADGSGRRPVFLLDDAQLAGHAIVQLLRDLHRSTGAVVMVTRTSGAIPTPDPLDCLRYELGATFLTLGPLSPDETRCVIGRLVGGPVHARAAAAIHGATGGNPALLYHLMMVNGLAGAMVRRDGGWQLPPYSGAPVELTERGANRLRSALSHAWVSLSFDEVADLCKIAVRTSEASAAAPLWAFAMLLRGQAAQGLTLLDGSGRGAVAPASERHLLTRALLLAFGLGRLDEATTLLAEAGSVGGRSGQRLLAVRVWILATVGRTREALVALASLSVDGDHAAAVFAHAAAAAVDLALDQPKRAVSHLRRAIIGADSLRAELPWLSPYLTGILTDALLLAGRVNEATVAAADFHAAGQGSGWDLTMSLSALIQDAARADPGPTPSSPRPRDGVAGVGFTPAALPAARPGSGERAMVIPP